MLRARDLTPSIRVRLLMAAALVVGPAWGGPVSAQEAHEGSLEHRHGPPAEEGWGMVPMPPGMPMLSGIEGEVPDVTPFLPGAGVDPSTLPEASPRRVVDVTDGDTLTLRASLVRRTIEGKTFTAYAYNGQYPGPLLRVAQGATVFVEFVNEIDIPSTVHWHGVRVDNRFDGVPQVTQELVQPGGTFLYRVRFPDAGIYWYHPHHREDVAQDLGLYGNILVASPDEDYYGPANQDVVLMLDDLLMDERGAFPFGREGATHTFMGRFGNVLLVNGEPDFEMGVDRGAVVRFHLTNVANTRTFNLGFTRAVPLKLVAGDLSRYEREERVGSVVIAPAERYVVEAHFEEAGNVALVNRVQAVDHVFGQFEPRVDTLATIRVSDEPAEPDLGDAFRSLRRREAVISEVDDLREQFDREPDERLTLTVESGRLPLPIKQLLALDTLFKAPSEWNDGMPMMNWLATSRNVRWILRDETTGRENMEIDWRYRVGDVIKLRLFNDPESVHPMHHPIHLHGQRFLILEQDGVRKSNLAWKDTAVVPVGSTLDLLVEFSNPGDWMLHCHIAEHLEAGMMMVVSVDPRDTGGLTPTRSRGRARRMPSRSLSPTVTRR